MARKYPKPSKAHLAYLAKTRTPKESAKMRAAQKQARKTTRKWWRAG